VLYKYVWGDEEKSETMLRVDMAVRKHLREFVREQTNNTNSKLQEQAGVVEATGTDRTADKTKKHPANVKEVKKVK